MQLSSLGSVQDSPFRDGQYPFADSSSRTSREGAIVDPNLFLDANIYAEAGFPVYILDISSSATDLEIRLAQRGDVVGVVRVAIDDVPNESGISYVNIVDQFDRKLGIMAADLFLLNSLMLSARKLTFTRQALEFAPSVIVPRNGSALSGFRVGEEIISGEVILVGENGVLIEHVTDPTDPDEIAVHILGDPLFERKACELEAIAFPSNIYLEEIMVLLNDVFVGTVTPDEYGSITIVDVTTPIDSSLRIQPGENGSGLEIGLAG